MERYIQYTRPLHTTTPRAGVGCENRLGSIVISEAGETQDQILRRNSDFFQNISTQKCEDISPPPDFLWLWLGSGSDRDARDTRNLHLSSLFWPFPTEHSVCFPCDSIRFARLPATSSVHNPRCSRQYSPSCHSWGSRADLGLKAAGKEASWTRCAKRKMAIIPFDTAARRPATCVPTKTAACDEH